MSMVDVKLFNKHRLLILAHLRDNGKSRFSVLKKALGISSDGNLAWHLKVLKECGLITTDKIAPASVESDEVVDVNNSRRECHINLTDKGADSLDEFKEEILELIPA